MELKKDNWTNKDYQQFLKYLETKQDINYKKFHSAIIKKEINLIGIKTPILRNIAKEIFKGNYESFLKLVTHTYYEETIIYGFIIANIKKLDNSLINYINIYKTKINNWATCDLFCSSLKIVTKNKEFFYNYIKENIKSKEEYIQRMCFVLLLNYYIEPKYLEDIFLYCDKYCKNTYYVNMAIAWLLSCCYIKYKEITLNYLKKTQLDTFTYNKTISKIIDSYRVSKEEKEILRKMKRD